MTTKSKAVVYVRFKQGVLDPQGVTIHKALQQMGYAGVASVRTGRFFELELRGNGSDLDEQIDEMCRKLLANPVIEDFEVERPA